MQKTKAPSEFRYSGQQFAEFVIAVQGPNIANVIMLSGRIDHPNMTVADFVHKHGTLDLYSVAREKIRLDVDAATVRRMLSGWRKRVTDAGLTETISKIEVDPFTTPVQPERLSPDALATTLAVGLDSLSDRCGYGWYAKALARAPNRTVIVAPRATAAEITRAVETVLGPLARYPHRISLMLEENHGYIPGVFLVAFTEN